MSLIVEVNQGKLKGREKKSVLTGKPYYAFQGIPYAKPPLGELRFQAPVPSEKWKGIYDATYERNICIQINFDGLSKTTGSEDCLYLNVNTPQPPADIKVLKPVMIYIHGGGYFSLSGSENICSPDYLIGHDVIIVTINYRLHALGFLNLGLPACPGNAGLKDQRMALKWVKENISNFGGDPENITVFGSSAGGASIQLHYLSPLSKGLFKKAIIQSGTISPSWTLTNNPYEMAFKLGEEFGFKGKDKEKLLDFLKQQKAIDILEKYETLNEKLIKLNSREPVQMPFFPSIEAIKDGAFLPDYPQKLMKTADPLPIIYGANNKEGMIFFFGPFDHNLEQMNQDFSIVLKNNFDIEPESAIPHLAKQIKNYYFGDKKISLETADELINLQTDLDYYNFYESIENITNSICPVYVYEFIYDGSFNIVKKQIEKRIGRSLKGACHSDECGYLLYSKWVQEIKKVQKATENDLKVINHMTTMWTNFAKCGNPSNEVNWRPSTSTEPSVLQIDVEPKLIKGTIYGERLQFLKKLFNPYLKKASVA